MLRVTLRGIRAHAVRLLATLLAVLLGVGFMAGTEMLGATLKRTFDDVFADVYGELDAVVRSSTEIASPFGPLRAPIDATALDAMTGNSSVAAAAGQVEGVVLILGPDGKPTASATTGPPTLGLNWIEAPELNGWELVDGAAPGGPDQVVLDAGTAEDTGYRPGDRVTIEIPALGAREFTISGVARFGDMENLGGADTVLFDTATAQELLGETGRFSFVSIAAADGVSQDQLVAALRPTLPAGTETITGAQFIDESADPFRGFIDQFTQFITYFGYIALFVGGFIIYNTFNVIVAQRTRELALLRAIGASRGQVLGAVVTEAAVVAAVASVLGLGFGVLLANGLRAALTRIGVTLPQNPIVIEPTRLAIPVVVAAVITVVSAALPAWRASRVAPVAAMSDAAVDRSNRSLVRLALGVLLLLAATGAFAYGLSERGSQALLGIAGSLVLTFVSSVAVGPLYARPLAGLLGAPLARLVGFTGHLARENARRNPARTATTAASLTIAVGLVTVIAITASSATAAINLVTEQEVGSDLIVTSDSFFGFSPELARTLDTQPSVTVATGFRVGFAQSGGQGVVVSGIDPAGFTAVFDIDMLAGLIEGLGPDGAAVSGELAEARGLVVGDPLPMTFRTSGGSILRVRAIFPESVLLQSDILLSQEGFDAQFPPPERVDTRVFVVLDEGVTPEEGKAALEPLVEPYPTASLRTLEDLQEEQAQRINFAVGFLYALLFLSVVIALIGVVNTLLLAVYERVRELGLLRAVGTLRGQVRSAIVQESVIIALIGATLGLAIGVGFGWALVEALASSGDDLPLKVVLPFTTLTVIMTGAVVAGVLAGVYPAWRAARLDVLEAIATE